MSRFALSKLFFSLLILTAFIACNDHVRVGEKEIAKKPADINELASGVIQESLDYLLNDKGTLNGLALKNPGVVNAVYHQNSYAPIWTDNGKWKPVTDSLLSFVCISKTYGLFPDDYHLQKLSQLRQQLSADTSSKENKLDAALWAEADMLLTSSFVQVVKDIKFGRIAHDSILVKNDSAFNNNFFIRQLHNFQQQTNLIALADSLEPKHSGYQQLKIALASFLPTAQFKEYTTINSKDSLHLAAMVRQRLGEEDSVTLKATSDKDSIGLAKDIRNYQKRNALTVDGKITPLLINQLNLTDNEKFVRIAINMDRYKIMLPAQMPEQYIWVNIPGYYMQVKESDSVRLASKVVVGKPQTPTPLITSAITNLVTYPQWSIPPSIIKKDVLPGLKKDPNYIARKGFSLIDQSGNVVDPYQVKWSKYQNAIPYKVIQGSGDENALGVMKFNFSNKYSVYLHDTNQRYLFGKKSRALSHGCVRVQRWDSLAYFILRNDSLEGNNAVSIDTVQAWLARKQKHVIMVHKRVPLFIRYFTCEVKNDKLIFYEDVYGDDRRLKEKYFTNKINSL